MKKISEIRQEIPNKEKQITDLIRFISNRTEKKPDYTLLLGAGCSITSGIRSAGELIHEWKVEIFKENHPKQKIEEVTYQEIEEYITSRPWYDNRNPYSSLFENRFDQDRQRRSFVEIECRNKIPSLGYCYLVKLVKERFFSTVFTTNFDDLVNDAFYRYSEERPIMCAHDSSINSITITSQRPKIIKLHGDYLFDDIKSTLRETESLQENMKNKFIEFAKDFGIIVVGYSGYDRSIMDVLLHLSKQGNYFKNGIYWCLTKDSAISEDLKRLLWSDQVYYVEIDGFDELLAEFHHSLIKKDLQISSFFSSRNKTIFKSIVDNEHLKKSNSLLIRSDLKKLELESDQDIIEKFYKIFSDSYDSEFKSKEDQFDDPREDEKIDYLKVSEKYESSKYDEAIELANEVLPDITSIKVKKDILYIKARSYKFLREVSKTQETYNEIIDLDNMEIQAIYELSKTYNSKEEANEQLDRAIKIDPFLPILYNRKADNLMRQEKSSLNDYESQIENCLEKSIEINPSFDNRAYQLKFDYFIDNSDADKNRKSVEKVLTVYRTQAYNHLVYIQTHLDYLIECKKKKFDEVKRALEDWVRDNTSIRDKERVLVFEGIKIGFKLNEKNYLEEIIGRAGSKFDKSSFYTQKKADCYYHKLSKPLEAIEFYEKHIRQINSTRSSRINSIIDLMECYVIAGSLEKIIPFMDMMRLDYYEYARLMEFYHELNGNPAKSIEFLDMRLPKNKANNPNYVVNKSFYLLKEGEFSSVKKLTKEFLERINFGIKHPEILVNYEYACLKLGAKVNHNRLDKIISSFGENKSKNELIGCCYLLKSDERQALKSFKKALDQDYDFKLNFKRWPIFDMVREKPSFKIFDL